MTHTEKSKSPENVVDLAQMVGWGGPGIQRALRHIELIGLGAKLGCLEFPTKAGQDRIPIVRSLTIMTSKVQESH